MHKYLAVLFTLVVLAGCSGGTGTVADVPNASDDAVTDNRFGWGDIGATDDEEVADDEGVVEEETTTTTATSATRVDIQGTVKKNLMTGEALNDELSATGGSGSYVWSIESVTSSTYSFPEWVSLGEQTENTVKIVGTSQEGKFKFKAKVCDEADDGNCDKKTFTVVAGSMQVLLPSVQVMTYSASKPRISEVTMPSIPALKEGELNTGFSIDTDRLQKQFKATGGTPPYTWTVKTEVEDEYWYCSYHDDAGCTDGGYFSSAWTQSQADEDDTSIFDLKGKFLLAVPYCDESPATGQCRGENSIRDTIRISVTDSLGVTSDVKSYRFKLSSPPEQIEDLFIDIRIKGDDMWGDGTSKVMFKLLNASNEVIATSDWFAPLPESHWHQWKVKLNPEPGYENVPIEQAAKLNMYLYDDVGCGAGIFDAHIDFISLQGKYWYIFKDTNSDDDYQVTYSNNCAVDPSTGSWTIMNIGTDDKWLQLHQPLDGSVPSGAREYTE